MTAVNIGRILAGNIALGDEVTVRGWLRTRRDSKAGLSFLAVNDGSSQDSLQVVASHALDNYQSEILSLTTGCSLTCTGRLKASQGKGQSVEIEAQSVAVVGWVEDPDTYPVPAKRHSFEYLREVAHLRARTNTFAAITRLRHGLARAIHDYLHRESYYWINTPIITTNDCEGAGELFRVSTLDLANLPRTEAGAIDFGQDFFGREAFLTVSGQLNAEALCLAMGRVYTFGPTFRAENSNTSRHLAEFWMVEPEVAFEDLTGAARLAEAMLKDVFAAVLEGYPQEMTFFRKFVDRECIARLEHVIETPFAHLDYDEAVRILQTSGKPFEFPIDWGKDLQSEHERYLSEVHVKGPLVVTNYPSAMKPFYMRQNDDGRTVAALDVLVPGIGEIVGGSQREERLDVLDSRLQAAGIDAADYGWYRDLRRYGTVPHSGFGLGFERTLGYVCGMSNVRDLIPFPRTPQHARF